VEKREVERKSYAESISQKEAKSRVVEKKPPMTVINLGTDVAAPRGEKIETSEKYEC
jgi:hypothetical protein